MSELKPCQCDLNLLNDRILNLGSGLATMPEDGTMQVNKTFLTAILGYMEELLGMRRTQPSNEPLTLEELRGMVGEWIWVEIEYPAWGCKSSGYAFVATPNTVGFLEKFLDMAAYGKTWLAYRRKPEPEGVEE